MVNPCAWTTAHLVGGLGVSLQIQDHQKHCHISEEKEQAPVISPSLLLLLVPAQAVVCLADPPINWQAFLAKGLGFINRNCMAT